MKLNPMVLARLNLFAVVPRLTELVEFDEEARKIASNCTGSIELSAMRLGAVRLMFRNGNLDVVRDPGGSADTGLWFPSPELLNKLFAGEKAVPVPYVWKPWNLPKLMAFQKLADRLGAMLGDPDKTLKDSGNDPKTKEFLVRCMLYTALAGVKELVEYDEKMAWFSKSTPDGTFLIKVLDDGPEAHLFIRQGVVTPGKGPIANPTVTLEIKNLDIAWELLQGRIDAMGALGACDIRMTGFLPLADNVNVVMDRLGVYLQPSEN